MITIAVGIASVGLWYYKIVIKNALETSYNAEIRLDGQQELFDDVYRDHASTVSSDDTASVDSSNFDNKSIHHAEVRAQPK